MKKIPTWLIVILVIALLIGSKLLFCPKKDPSQMKGGAGKAGAPIPVNYYVVKTTNFENEVYTAGKIGAFNQVDLVPEIAGKIVNINFKEGESVTKGSLLVKLNDADLQASLLKVRTNLRLSEQKLKRLEQLLKVNGISQEEFEMQENELQSLKADEAFTLAQISKTSIVAPFSGQAGLKNISEGSFVSQNTPVVSLVQMKPVYVEFSVPEKYNGIFTKGSLIKFRSEKRDSTKLYEARVYAIEPRVDEATRSIRARAEYTGSQTFYPGSFVNTYVQLGATNDAILVPTQAVVATLKGQKVYLAKMGQVQEIPVKIGLRTDKTIQITEGLSVGDTVLTTGLMSLKKESKVKLLKATQ
jgi:membrane fusion protein, multidrug efflux system